ncbi:lytic transglycosylase domain-containing protein [Paracoccus suum]|uniref:Lytic transglycosylase domain-containing protein n=1 Tax=Paracoccus suum TaxID=2259340 RepID=A0A344PPM6_9RHOB|nr:lytic transglycosylase domain-containing protein [Paracoccus suum]
MSGRGAMLALMLGLAACGSSSERMQLRESPRNASATAAGATPEMQALIARYAAEYSVPVTLVHRVVQRESMYRPTARNGPYYGLMQILPATARTMGYRGDASGLLDAETNLKYGVKYLRGAWLVSGGSESRAVMWYAKGYYYEAKRKGLLKETGLRG